MANVLTSPILVGTRGYLIQNLGPGNLYVGESDVTEENGVQLLVGEALAVSVSNHQIYVVSDSTSDVRILGQGTGIFATSPPEPE